MPHSHSHSHGEGCAHESSDLDNALEMGIQYSLYQKIDMNNLECLNETVEGSGKTVFKPYENRLDTTKFVQSDVDEELLFNIPFTGHVKLKGIIIAGANDESHPSKLRLFKNREFMTFDDAAAEPEQELELSKDPKGEIEYSLKVTKFSSVRHLSLHFPGNFGNENTKIYYIGLRGEFFEAPKQGIVIANYEVRPQAEDHRGESHDISNDGFNNPPVA